MSAFKDLTAIDQKQVSGYIDLVKGWVDINDIDSKNSLREVTYKIAKHSISKKFSPIQKLTHSVFAYLQEPDNESKHIDTINEIISFIFSDQ